MNPDAREHVGRPALRGARHRPGATSPPCRGDLVEHRATVLVTPSVDYREIGDRWDRALREAYAGDAGVAEALERAAATSTRSYARNKRHKLRRRPRRPDGLANSGRDHVVHLRPRASRRGKRSGSPLAARSYPADRASPEDDCGLRTPFQRDRDRIVHCKAFRRLKHKTQVFVAPEGDHYRTRLTHTLETTQISRTVARALGLNEDLTEAIGLGHDLGHPPFGHIGEDVLDRCARERFGRGFRHNEHSLRVVDELERLNLTAPVRDGILRHISGAGEPATLEGKIVRLVDRIAYINHDIDDALRAGVLRADLPARRSRCWATPARGGSTGSSTTWSSTPRRRGHRAGRGGRRRDAAPAQFMFQNVYLGPTARPSTRRSSGPARAVRVVLRAPRGAAGGGGRRSEADRVIDYLAGMTDRFAIRAWTERAVPQGLARLVAALHADSSAGCATRSTSSSSSARGRSCASPASSGYRAVPVPRRADAVVRDRPGREALPLLRLRRGRRRLQVRDGDRGVDFAVGAGVAGRAGGGRARGARARIRGAAARRRRERLLERCWSAPRPTTCACCGRREAGGAREYLLGRGLAEATLRQFRVGYSPSAWDTVLMASRRAGLLRTRRCSRPGWPSARGDGRGGSTTSSAARSCSR